MPPVLDEQYIPFIPGANQTIARAQDPDDAATMVISLHRTKELFVSCKGTGRPKPEITWAVDGTEVDFSAQNATYSVSVPRPGSSVLVVQPPLDTVCRVYECRMDNAAATLPVRGTVEVCGERKYVCYTVVPPPPSY